MDYQITVLAENTVDGLIGVVAEHGFSLFIEREGENILFDTGQGLAILNNSLVLNKDLRSIDKIILSHGHGDHSGGLADVLQIRGDVDVIAHPGIFLERYKVAKKKKKKKFVGMPHNRAFLEGLGARFQMTEDFQEISKGIYITGEVPRKNSFEKGDPDLYAKENGQLVPDPFVDDLSLVLDTKEGLIIILGCAHKGLINILDHINQKLGTKKIRAIMGGTHLKSADHEQLVWTMKELERFDIEGLYVSHCTGMKASIMLAEKLGKLFIPLNAGSVVEF
jgi:7,8-dihydropterin-6-yl-methyl-4-(beta-D-ribofuranosyl)aminobenzene 5'-phosphate synthase